MNHIHRIINNYLESGYSLIPVDKQKKPCIYWKQYQHKRAGIKDILKWHIQFDTLNIGIVTGDISGLAVIDIDDLSLLPELKERIPEIAETTRVKFYIFQRFPKEKGDYYTIVLIRYLSLFFSFSNHPLLHLRRFRK